MSCGHNASLLNSPSIAMSPLPPLLSVHRPGRPRPAPPGPREPASAPLDPALIERDKVPANVQTLGPADFEHEKAPDLLDAISRRLLGTINADQWPVVYGTGIFINQPSGDVAPVGVLS